MLPTLAAFNRLETLILAPPQDLDVGFYPPGCGNVYMGPRGEEHRRRVCEEGRRCSERVARMVFARMRGVRYVWMGEWARAEVVRDAGVLGGVEWVYGRRNGYGEIR